MPQAINILLGTILGACSLGCQPRSLTLVEGVSAEGAEEYTGTQLLAPGFNATALVPKSPWFSDGWLTERTLTLVGSRGTIQRFDRTTGRLIAFARTACTIDRRQWREVSLSADGTVLVVKSHTGACLQRIDLEDDERGGMLRGGAWSIAGSKDSGIWVSALPMGRGALRTRNDAEGIHLQFLPWGASHGPEAHVTPEVPGRDPNIHPMLNTDGTLVALRLADGIGAETHCRVVAFPIPSGGGRHADIPSLDVETDCHSFAWRDSRTLVTFLDANPIAWSVDNPVSSRPFSATFIESFIALAYSDIHHLHAVALLQWVLVFQADRAEPQAMNLCPGGLVRRLQFDRSGALLVVCSKFTRILD